MIMTMKGFEVIDSHDEPITNPTRNKSGRVVPTNPYMRKLMTPMRVRFIVRKGLGLVGWCSVGVQQQLPRTRRKSRMNGNK